MEARQPTRRERALAAGLVALGLAALLRLGALVAAPPAAELGGWRSVRLDPNRASGAELGLLPGLGPARVAALLAERERRGGFRRLEELLDVPGIGSRTLEQLAPLLVFPGREP
ncbi:MAG: helix-hairpin-helix domain-containing protein [Planctomycetes bacterium]|nr:helix-hairpin-helix domain-containing protein [Planctomycetota bacterium]